MYIVISNTNPDDSYSIHTELDKAKAAFESEKQDIEDAEFYGDAVYLAKVTPGIKFGWDTQGDFFGGEIIENFSLE